MMLCHSRAVTENWGQSWLYRAATWSKQWSKQGLPGAPGTTHVPPDLAWEPQPLQPSVAEAGPRLYLPTILL